MFQIFIFYINLGIRIGFFGYFFEFFDFSDFQIIRSGSVNNTSGSDMFYNTLQDPLRYFLHFGSCMDRVFRFGSVRISGYGFYAQLYSVQLKSLHKLQISPLN